MKKHSIHHIFLLGTLSIATASGAVVIIDVSPFDGINGEIPVNSSPSFDFAGVTNGLELFNQSNFYGLEADFQLTLATGGSNASPTNFSGGTVIDSSANFTGSTPFSGFHYIGQEAPDFGPNSYMGFRTELTSGNFNYGWIEITWDGAANEYEILAAAYEDSGAPIAAGFTGVPEPSTALLTGLAALGLIRRRR